MEPKVITDIEFMKLGPDEVTRFTGIVTLCAEQYGYDYMDKIYYLKGRTVSRKVYTIYTSKLAGVLYGDD